MNCSEPEDDNEDQREVDDAEEYDIDWMRLRKLFKEKTRQLRLYAIDFAPTSASDVLQLPVPKHGSSDYLFTAGFFCKENSDQWYIYRVVLVVNRQITPDELPQVYKKLEIGGYREVSYSRRRKFHPLSYLRAITL